MRSRLNALLAIVLILGLAINITRLMLEAGPRVQAEDQSVLRLAREFIETLVVSLNETADPDAKLNRIIQDLNRLRHVSITREGSVTTNGAAATDDGGDGREGSSVPAWFVALIHPETTAITVPISLHGYSSSLVVTSHPDDEMNEIWDGIVTQLLVGSAIAITLLLLTMLVISRALAPLRSLSNAMTDIEAGFYDTRVEPAGSPELAAICNKLNHLSATLGNTVEDKRRLAEAAVSLQDAERKEVARELHDEFGPYLFALRAHASSLAKLADAREPSEGALRKHGNAILEQINALQRSNRRILERLRPVALAELGLPEAIDALVRSWGDAHAEVAIETLISRSLGETSEIVQLTIYRIIQESLTNVFRHAGATTVEISVSPAPSRRTGHPAPETQAVAISIRDNGAGLPIGHKQGLGMIGMRERVSALGGTMSVESTSSGVSVKAVLPCSTRQFHAVEDFESSN